MEKKGTEINPLFFFCLSMNWNSYEHMHQYIWKMEYWNLINPLMMNLLRGGKKYEWWINSVKITSNILYKLLYQDFFFYVFVYCQLITSTLSCNFFFNVQKKKCNFPFLIAWSILWSLFYFYFFFFFHFVVKHIHFNLDNRRIFFFFVILNIIHFIQYPNKIPQKALENKKKIK